METVTRLPYEVDVNGIPTQCWGFVDPHGERIDVPSDYLLILTRGRMSPNTVSRRASALGAYWNFSLSKGTDPLNPELDDMKSYVTALQTTPKKQPLTGTLRALPGQGAAPVTVKARLDDLGHFFRWARDMGLTSEKSASVVENYPKPRVPTYRSVERLDEAAWRALQKVRLHPRDRFYIELLNCGLRKGEALSLLVEDWHATPEDAAIWGCTEQLGPHLHVTPREGARHDRRTKLPLTDKGRAVPLSEALLRAKREWDVWRLRNLPHSLESNVLLQTTQGPTATQPWSATAADQVFTNRLPKADPALKNLAAHQLRHEFASQCREAGIPDELISAWLGHNNPHSIEIYNHPHQAAFRSAVDKLEAHRKALGESK
jgi:site-specific recombinase XerD